jgi:hypothetical protein
MEYPAPCHSIREIEKIPKLAVKLGLAEIVKEEGSETDSVFTRVYHILVKDEIMPVNVRFWYDRRYDKASFKISSEGLAMIMQSMTVLSFLTKLGKKMSTNGHGVNMDDLEGVLKEALARLPDKDIAS